MVRNINEAFNDDSNPIFLGKAGGIYFYKAVDDNMIGQELWKSDGTEAGTVLVKDINPIGSSNISNAVVMNNIMYFSATNGISVNGFEFWKSDGTQVGTVLVKDIFPGIDSGTEGT